MSKAALAEYVFVNTVHNTGFLIRLENFAIACIIENNISVKKENQKTKYFIVSSDEMRELNLFKKLPDSHSVVDRLCDILNLNEPDLDEVEYILQFLSIPSVLTKLERKTVLQKHKSHNQQNMIREKQRNDYKSMSPVEKQALVKKHELKYKEINPIKKQALLKNEHLKYKEMDPINKLNLLENLHLEYRKMDPTKKQILENLHLKYKEIEPLEKKDFS